MQRPQPASQHLRPRSVNTAWLLRRCDRGDLDGLRTTLATASAAKLDVAGVRVQLDAGGNVIKVDTGTLFNDTLIGAVGDEDVWRIAA